jgi:hypothetical protein
VSQTSWRISSLQAVPFFNSILTHHYMTKCGSITTSDINRGRTHT